jgi:hypothetical protein
MRKELYLNLGLIVLGWLMLATPQSFATQGSTAEHQKLSEDQQEHLSLFSAMVANGEAWSTGDLLVRTVTTFDAVTEENDRPTGLMRRVEGLNRVAFDLEHGRFMRIHVVQDEVTNYQTDPPDSLHNNRWRGDCLDMSLKRYWTNAVSDQFKSAIVENPSRHLNNFPDYRFFPMQTGAMNQDLTVAAKSFVEQLKGRKLSVTAIPMPHNRLRLRMIEASPKIELVVDPATADGNSNPIVPKMISEWTFDQTSLLPTSSRTMFQSESREPQTMVRKVYRWKNINDVFVPVFMQATTENRQQRTADGQAYIGTQTTEYTFHWFSLNKPLDESYFDGSKFRDEQTVLKHVVPELAGADSLLTDTENPPLKPRSTDDN